MAKPQPPPPPSPRSSSSSSSGPSRETHLQYLTQALSLARLSPPKPTNFRVGCVVVSYQADPRHGTVLSTGYTLELPGNTHAEQNALAKLGFSPETNGERDGHEDRQNEANIGPVTLYTTLEPCGLRLSGNLPCVERIIATRRRRGRPSRGKSDRGGGAEERYKGEDHGQQQQQQETEAETGVQLVVFGAREPGTFVEDSKSLQRLDEAGVRWEWVAGLDEDILKVATEGHRQETTTDSTSAVSGTGTTTGSSSGPRPDQPETNIDDITPEERTRQEALPRNPKKRMMEVPVPR